MCIHETPTRLYTQRQHVHVGPCVSQCCGLGLDVSVSRRSRDVPTSRLSLVSTKIVNVSVSSRSREADVSVSSRSRLEILTSRLGLVLAGEANVSVSGGERLGLELLRLVPIPGVSW